MNVEYIRELLDNYSKDLYEAKTTHERGDVQIKYAMLIMGKIHYYHISANENTSTYNDVSSIPILQKLIQRILERRIKLLTSRLEDKYRGWEEYCTTQSILDELEDLKDELLNKIKDI